MPVKRAVQVAVALAVLAGALAFFDCGEYADPRFGSEGKTEYLKLDAAEYRVVTGIWVCDVEDTTWMVETFLQCEDDNTGSDNDIFPCPVEVNHDDLLMVCTLREEYDDCVVETVYQLSGEQTEDKWKLEGKIEQSANPPGCHDVEKCRGIVITVYREGAVPDPCK